MSTKNPSGPRVAALVGHYSSGKPSLLESILKLSATIQRTGAVTESNLVGQNKKEANAHPKSAQATVP